MPILTVMSDVIIIYICESIIKYWPLDNFNDYLFLNGINKMQDI